MTPSDQCKTREFEHLTPDEILKVNIPTGVPCSYTFDSDWNITDKHYIGDPETIAGRQSVLKRVKNYHCGPCRL